MGMIDQINRRFVVVNEKMNGGGVGVSPTREKTIALLVRFLLKYETNLKEKTSTKKIQKPNNPDGANSSRPKKTTKTEKKSARPSWEGDT